MVGGERKWGLYTPPLLIRKPKIYTTLEYRVTCHVYGQIAALYHRMGHFASSWSGEVFTNTAKLASTPRLNSLGLAMGADQFHQGTDRRSVAGDG